MNEDGLDKWVDFIGDLDVQIKWEALREEKQILSQMSEMFWGKGSLMEGSYQSFCIQTHLVANYYIDGQLGKQMMTK